MQDADDVSEPERIEKLLAAFEEGIDFVGCHAYCFDENGTFGVFRGRREYPVARDFWKGISFVHASILFRRECLMEIGGYCVV